MKLSLNVIGAGKLGKALIKLFLLHQLVILKGIFNRTEVSIHNVITFLNAGKACLSIEELPEADIWMITTPDDQIETIYKQLCSLKKLKPHMIVFHCSGCLSSTILSTMTGTTKIASIHPLRSFSHSHPEMSSLNGTYCALEGEAEAKTVLSFLFETIGAIPFEIYPEHKVFYHLAAVTASNYIVTLAEIAFELLGKAEIHPDIAKQLIVDLMSGTIQNINQVSAPKLALTGPLQRGDFGLIEQHLHVLEKQPYRKLYCLLGLFTLPFVQLPKKIIHKIQTLFTRIFNES
jgi:predicted short-subunit dehydrogenase-like oxidoreductase (DUF2520 family)